MLVTALDTASRLVFLHAVLRARVRIALALLVFVLASATAGGSAPLALPDPGAAGAQLVTTVEDVAAAPEPTREAEPAATQLVATAAETARPLLAALPIEPPALPAALPLAPYALLPTGFPPEDDPEEDRERARRAPGGPAEDAPDTRADPMPSAEDDPSLLAARPAHPLDDSPTLVTVALGVTALAAALSGLYSRYRKHDLLRSEPRRRIHDLVSAQPGATLADLMRATSLSRTAIVHHCQMLEKQGLLASRHDGLHRRFYPPGQKGSPDPRPPTASEARVLEALRRAGPMTQAQLAAQLEVSRQAVSQQVQRLRKHGRISLHEEAGPRRWSVAERESEATEPA